MSLRVDGGTTSDVWRRLHIRSNISWLFIVIIILVLEHVLSLGSRMFSFPILSIMRVLDTRQLLSADRLGQSQMQGQMLR